MDEFVSVRLASQLAPVHGMLDQSNGRVAEFGAARRDQTTPQLAPIRESRSEWSRIESRDEVVTSLL